MAPSKQAALPPFSKDEKVLCFHGDLMYEAKITDLRSASDPTNINPQTIKADDAQYRVHYKGWKASWDDWVSQDRIRKFTDDNKQLAAQLQQAARLRTAGGSKSAKKAIGKAAGPGDSEMSSARGSEERAAINSFAGRGKRGGRDYELESVSGMFPFILSRASPFALPFPSLDVKVVGDKSCMSPDEEEDTTHVRPPQQPACLLAGSETKGICLPGEHQSERPSGRPSEDLRRRRTVRHLLQQGQDLRYGCAKPEAIASATRRIPSGYHRWTSDAMRHQCLLLVGPVLFRTEISSARVLGQLLERVPCGYYHMRLLGCHHISTISLAVGYLSLRSYSGYSTYFCCRHGMLGIASQSRYFDNDPEGQSKLQKQSRNLLCGNTGAPAGKRATKTGRPQLDFGMPETV